MRTRGLGWWIAVAIFLSYAAVVSGQDGPKLETMDQYTRLQIPTTSGSSFRMLSGKSGEVTLTVDRVATGALEALKGLSDKRVQAVQVRTLGLDKASIEVRFREPKIEAFAYQQGSVLVLDLWKQAPEKKAAAVAAALPKQVKHPPKNDRKPASSHPAAKAVAQVEPLRIERDLFQKFLFPMPPLEITAKDKGFDLPMKFELDEHWKFSEGDKNEEDGKGFELAKKLYKAKKYGLCLKTIEIVIHQHPNTEHGDELEFLRALAYKKLGESTKSEALEAKADKMLEELSAQRDEEAQPLPFARQIVLYFAQKSLDAQNWLQAIQYLEYVATVTKQTDPEFPYIQILLADCYGKVSQPRRAERIYRFLTEKFPKHQLAKEAYYRIADLLSGEKNYQRTTEEGEAALKAYPEYERTRSETVFHIGEAYFWLGQYDKAEKFLNRYATKVASPLTTASLAWVRLGEIEEVHHNDVVAAHADYLKAKNGYPFSKGDLMATVRLARLDLPTEKELSFVVRTLTEMLEDKTVDWDLRRMAELTLADYQMKGGEVEKAIAIASAGMAQTDGVVYELYKRAYQKGLFLKLSGLAKEKKYADALALYGQERKWLEQYGPETFRVVAGIYRGLGLYASANSMMERYATEIEKGRVPAGYDGQAKIGQEKAANSFARGAYSDTITQLAGSQDAMSSYLRMLSHFRLKQKREAYAAADRSLPLMRAAKGQFSDEMIENLGEVLIDRDTVERDFKRMETEVAQLKGLASKESDLFAFAGADALWYQKRNGEAAKAYREALEKFPTSARKDRATYNLGMCLVGMGKREEAVKLLTGLQNSGQSVWAESAKQELELIEWEKKYSSVLRTLPPSGLGIAN